MSEILNRKLSDVIRTDGIMINTFQEQPNESVFREEERLVRVIRRSPVFYIQNAVDYFKQFGAHINAQSLPCVAPPYPAFFMEFRLNQENGPYLHNAGFRNAGVLFEATQSQHIIKEIAPEDASNTRWLYTTTTTLKHSNGNAIAVDRTFLPISETGAIIGAHEMRTEPLCDSLGVNSQLSSIQKVTLFEEMFYYTTLPALFAINFTHVKGTAVREELPPKGLSKRHQKKTGQPLVKYHIIDIEPMRNLLLREGNVESEGLEIALHKVRGHFKDYRNRGLFGTNKGIFWFPDHNRGTADAGIIIQDYNVDAPN